MVRGNGQTVTIERPTYDVDDGGHPTPEFAPVGTAVVFIQPRSGGEREVGGAKQEEDMVVGYAEPTVDVRPEDLIRWGTRVFRIESVRRPGEFQTSRTTAHLKLDMVERSGDY